MRTSSIGNVTLNTLSPLWGNIWAHVCHTHIKLGTGGCKRQNRKDNKHDEAQMPLQMSAKENVYDNWFIFEIRVLCYQE